MDCVLFQGKIACSNVLSDLYAMGVTECDNMLMLLALSQKLTDKERDVVSPLMIRGFKVSVVLRSFVCESSGQLLNTLLSVSHFL